MRVFRNLFRTKGQEPQSPAITAETTIEATRSLDILLDSVGNKLLYRLFLIPELRDLVFIHLKPGEVLIFCQNVNPFIRRSEVCAWLSPVRLLFPDPIWLHRMTLRGYTFTVVTETREFLLAGPIPGWPVPKTVIMLKATKRQEELRQWSIILCVRREGIIINADETLSLFQSSGFKIQEYEKTMFNFKSSGGSEELSVLCIGIERMGWTRMVVNIPWYNQKTSPKDLLVPSRILVSWKTLYKKYPKSQPTLFFHHFPDHKIYGPIQAYSDLKTSDYRRTEDITLAICLRIGLQQRMLLYDLICAAWTITIPTLVQQ